MKARLEHRRTEVWADGTMIEAVVWRLPAPDVDRPHGFKYRLYAGRNGRCLVRYDNERGKGDHVHYGDREQPYQFVSVAQLLADFAADIRRLTGGQP